MVNSYVTRLLEASQVTGQKRNYLTPLASGYQIDEVGILIRLFWRRELGWDTC